MSLQSNERDIIRAFEPWISWCEENSVIGSLFDPKNIKSMPPMHDLHRIFWAVSTGRDGVAKKIWRSTNEKIIVAFMASYTYKNCSSESSSSKALVNNQRSLQYDTVAHRLLHMFAESRAVKDEVVFDLLSQAVVFPPEDTGEVEKKSIL
eukprot:SAG31_NODE_22261_length_530_cov_0.821346_1_plen_149_part_01